MSHVLLLALDSVGIDPLGHGRSESVYGRSRFLFPRNQRGDLIAIGDGPVPGALVETDVTGSHERGAIECALTYTSIFSGRSAVDQHGLMRGLGLDETLLKSLVAENNLFEHFDNPCLVNSLFPFHLPFLGSSPAQDLLPHLDRQSIEATWRFRGEPVLLKGKDKHGFAELFTMGEINQNIFVHAVRQAGVKLRSWDDVRGGNALTSSLTHELEADFGFCGLEPLPVYSVQDAAAVLVRLVKDHAFTFYKYQIPDLVSHTGRVELARQVFAIIEDLVEAVLRAIDPADTTVIVTSDHGHLEQLTTSHAHPKTKVPTWYFGPEPLEHANRLRRPEAIFHQICRGHLVG